MSHDPLALAAKALSVLCDEIDNAEKIDGILHAAFDDAALSLEFEVDKRIAFDQWSKTNLVAAKEAYRFYRDRAEYIEQVREKFKARLVEAMQANPNLPFRGKLGKLSCVENPASVEYAFGDKHVDDGIIDFYGIPAGYVKEKVSFEIDHARVKADLLAGKELGWAKLAEKKCHVRFPQARKPKQIEGETE